MAKVGRKSKMEEFGDGSVLTMTTAWIVANWYKFTHEEKMKVALAIVPRSITQKIEANVNHTAQSILETVQEAQKVNRITNHVQCS